MIYAQRIVTHREVVNRFGKLGCVPYCEFFKTTNEDFFNEQNKRKRIPFEKVERDAKFLHIELDRIYSEIIPH